MQQRWLMFTSLKYQLSTYDVVGSLLHEPTQTSYEQGMVKGLALSIDNRSMTRR